MKLGSINVLRVGDWVEVKTKDEILQSLDKNGRLEGMPFMPQMFKYCGQQFRVYKCAHKTCDTITDHFVSRRLSDGIHLDIRCDGQAYGGCQAACLIFWKKAWLKPLPSSRCANALLAKVGRNNAESERTVCVEADVYKNTQVRNLTGGNKTRYVCQATQVLEFTTSLPWWKIGQYLEDYRSGNVTLGQIFAGFFYVAYYYGTLAFSDTVGRPARWFYDRFQALWGGVPFPRRKGTILRGQLTPTAALNLQPGELVRIKPYKDILTTLDFAGRNRGLGFDAELVPYCGQVCRVRARVNKFVDEKTGTMKFLKTPAVILEGVCCQSRYSNNRMFCPRGIYSWWRENWLERVSDDDTDSAPQSIVSIAATRTPM